MAKKVIVWGMGNNAKNILPQLKEYSFAFEVIYFTDGKCESNQTEWSNYPVICYRKIKEIDFDYLLIACSYEWEVRKKISVDELCSVDKIISVDEMKMMWELGLFNIDKAYEKYIRCSPSDISEIVKKRKVYRDLIGAYSYCLFESSSNNSVCKQKVELEKETIPIWVFWHSGLNEAPEVVKICVSSIRKALRNDEKLIFLDKDNYFEYIDVPDAIQRKWEAGIISNTEFSDIIRIKLLNVYGGIWIDSTVFIMGNKLPDYLRDNELFLYRIKREDLSSYDPHMIANWIIAAHKGNRIIKKMDELLEEYWEHENKARHYFFFHILFYIVANIYSEEWRKVEIALRNPSTLLRKELGKNFNADRYERIKEMSVVQKLSWKLPFDNYSRISTWQHIRNQNE